MVASDAGMAMLGDKRLEVRSRAMQMVREARARRRPGPVRHFRVHGLAANVSARHYIHGLCGLGRY